MSARRGGLGRGLGALIPSAPTAPEDAAEDAAAPDDAATAAAARAADPARTSDAGAGSRVTAVRESTTDRAAEPAMVAAPLPIAGATLVTVAPTDVEPNPRQPREAFDEEELDGLAVSLRDVGMLQPLVVRPAAGAPGRYQLIAGERRWRAAQRAGLATVPAIVRTTEDGDLLKEALLENIHRVQLNPLEEAAAYQQLLDEFGVTQEELAARLGRSRPTVSNLLRLLNLPSSVQRRIAAGVLSAGHAKALLALPDAASQERLADRVVREGMSVRATEEAVRLELLEEPATSRAGVTRARVTLPGLLDLQEDLSDALMTRVRITMGARRGHLRIDFLSVDDLERIVGVIADGLGGGIGTTSATGAVVAAGTGTVRAVRAGGASDGGRDLDDDLGELGDLADLDGLSASATALLRELDGEDLDPLA